MSEIDYGSMTDEELAEKSEELAAERTRVRLEQNKVSAEQEIRRSLATMSGAGREALLLRLSGEAKPKAETKKGDDK